MSVICTCSYGNPRLLSGCGGDHENHIHTLLVLVLVLVLIVQMMTLRDCDTGLQELGYRRVFLNPNGTKDVGRQKRQQHFTGGF